MRVLLIEDDRMIGQAMRDSLRESGDAVDWVMTAREACLATADLRYDCVLLDLGLPDGDGLDLLRQWRATAHDLPLIIVSARDGLDDRLQGLDGGADDFVLKPFDMAELMARMRAVVRRKGGRATSVLSSATLSLDVSTQTVCVESGPPVSLSHREFALLQALLTRPGAICSRRALEDRIYGWGEEVDSNAVEFLIHSLRRKLGQRQILNVRGAGWRVAQ